MESWTSLFRNKKLNRNEKSSTLRKPSEEALSFCKTQGGMFQAYLAKLYDHIKESKEDYDWKEKIEDTL